MVTRKPVDRAIVLTVSHPRDEGEGDSNLLQKLEWALNEVDCHLTEGDGTLFEFIPGGYRRVKCWIGSRRGRVDEATKILAALGWTIQIQ